MRRLNHFIRIILFLAVFLLCFRGISRVFQAKDNEELSPYYYQYSKNTFDVIIAGSSVSKNGIQPVQLWENNGIVSYNLSNGNQSLACSYYILQDALERDHPKLIVLDVTYAEDSGVVRSDTFVHYLTDEMPLSDKWRYRMIRDLIPEEKRTEFYWPFYSYHTRWKELSASDFKNGTYQKNTLGAVTSGRTMSLSTTLFNRVDTDDALPEVSRDYLNRIITLCRDNQTPLLLICCPVSGDNGGDVSEGDFNRRRSIMKQIASIASENSIPFLNFLEDDSALGLEPYQDYRDGVHLNYWGSEKLTSFLGNYIRQNYDIPDRRTDSDYTTWLDPLVQKYQKAVRKQTFATTSRTDTEFRLLTDHLQDEDLLYLICGQDYNGSSEELSSDIRSGLSSLGIIYDETYTGLTNVYALIEGGTVLESGQNIIAEDIDVSKKINGIRTEVRTNAMADDADLHYNNIIINGGNVAPKEDGLCIAVVDTEEKELLDCVTLRYDGTALTHFQEAGN